MSVDPPSLSSDTPHGRAVTRSLLMALCRPRAFFFQASIPTVIVLGVASLGFQPIVKQAERLDRWRRYEWTLFETFADWLRPRATSPDQAAALVRVAQEAGRPTSLRPLVAAAILAGGALIAYAAWHGGWPAVLDTVFQPQTLRPTAIGFSIVLSLAWATLLALLLRQHLRTVAWLVALSTTLAALNLRPVPATPFRVPWVKLALAGLLAVVGPTWAAAMVATIALQNGLVAGMRDVRMRLVERVLELTDASGLPVEFDVEETTPEAFVTARPAPATGAIA